MFITRPLKAPSESVLPYKLTYPVMASPKLNGIRCLLIDPGQDGCHHVLSRTLKTIPNTYIRSKLQNLLMEADVSGDLDGELMTYTDSKMDDYNTIQSKVMSEGGTPDFKFHAFDYVKDGLRVSYALRYNNLLTLSDNPKLQGAPFFDVLFHTVINSIHDLDEYEAYVLKLGFEGVMIRVMSAPYLTKDRCTLNDNNIFKLKRFVDSEAIIIGMEELMHNGNPAYEENGRTKRSKSKDLLFPAGTMGKLIVQDLQHPEWTSKERKKKGLKGFEIGTGFTEKDRAYYWTSIKPLLEAGNTTIPAIKYKRQAGEVKDAPRHGVYLGVRNLTMD